MRLLRADTDELVFETVHDDSHRYAILSHRWLAEEEEVTFADIVKSSNNITDRLRAKAGWKKLEWCKQQAVRDGLRYVWADTACIDKSSSQELTESINSMYADRDPLPQVFHGILAEEPEHSLTGPAEASNRLESAQTLTQQTEDAQISQADTSEETSPLLNHHDTSKLEARLSVPTLPTAPASAPSKALEGWNREAFAETEWFTRAWTLQEMIASGKLRFYNMSWTLIGELEDLAADVTKITGVHVEALTKQRPLKSYSIAQKMSWAADRRCTKIEDQAYSLLGLLNVSMVVNYGEGRASFQRLQDELLRTSSDDSIFAFKDFREFLYARDLAVYTSIHHTGIAPGLLYKIIMDSYNADLKRHYYDYEIDSGAKIFRKRHAEPLTTCYMARRIAP